MNFFCRNLTPLTISIKKVSSRNNQNYAENQRNNLQG